MRARAGRRRRRPRVARGATPSAGRSSRRASPSGRWSAPPRSCGLDARRRARPRRPASSPRARRRSASGSACSATTAPAQAIRAILALPLVTGDFRYPGGGAAVHDAPATTARRGRRRAPGRDAGAARALDQHVPPGRALLTGEADPPVTSLVVFNANPAATRARPEPRPRGPAPRGPLHRRARAAAGPTRATTPTSCCRPRCSPSTSTCTRSYGHHYATLNLPATAAPGEALPNTRDLPPPRRRPGARPPAPARQRRGPRAAAARHARGARARPPTRSCASDGYARRTGVPRRHGAVRRGRLPHPDAAGRSCSTRRSRRAAVDPLVGYTPPHEAADPSSPRATRWCWSRPAGRFFMNSTFALAAVARGANGPAAACTCTRTTRRRAAWPTASAVRVRNDRGSFLADGAVDDATRPGLAFTYKAYWARLSRGRPATSTP